MPTEINHSRRRVLGAAAATIATGGLVLAGAAALRAGTPVSGEGPCQTPFSKEHRPACAISCDRSCPTCPATAANCPRKVG